MKKLAVIVVVILLVGFGASRGYDWWNYNVNTPPHANPNQKVITIPEGYPLKFQADFVEKAWPGMGKPYLTSAASPSWRARYDFLGSVPGNANPPLEGYLFPDTYTVDPGLGVDGLIKEELDQFGVVFSPDLRAAVAQPSAGRPAENVE